MSFDGVLQSSLSPNKTRYACSEVGATRWSITGIASELEVDSDDDKRAAPHMHTSFRNRVKQALTELPEEHAIDKLVIWR